MRLRSLAGLSILAACVVASGAASAEPGKGQRGGRAEHAVKPLNIPPGQLPPAGMCRVWFPGKPPGHQPAPGKCSVLRKKVPPGAWLLQRPGDKVQEVAVNVYDDSRPNVVLEVRFFDAESGSFLRLGIQR